MALRTLGIGKVLQDDRTGRLVVDKSTIRRKHRKGRRFAGDDDLGEDDLGDEDLGEDDDLGDDEDVGDEDSEELGDEDVGDDEDLAADDDMGEDELGGRRRGRRKARRLARRTTRKARRHARRGDDQVKWGKTALAGESNTPTDVGDQITITIRPQHWFKAQDITFTGDSAAKVDTIFFGERPIWNNSTGVPVAVFGSTGMLRGLLRGQKIRPGLDIIIKGTAGTATTTTTATLIGYKPINTSC